MTDIQPSLTRRQALFGGTFGLGFGATALYGLSQSQPTLAATVDSWTVDDVHISSDSGEVDDITIDQDGVDVAVEWENFPAGTHDVTIGFEAAPSGGSFERIATSTGHTVSGDYGSTVFSGSDFSDIHGTSLFDHSDITRDDVNVDAADDGSLYNRDDGAVVSWDHDAPDWDDERDASDSYSSWTGENYLYWYAANTKSVHWSTSNTHDLSSFDSLEVEFTNISLGWYGELQVYIRDSGGSVVASTTEDVAHDDNNDRTLTVSTSTLSGSYTIEAGGEPDGPSWDDYDISTYIPRVELMGGTPTSETDIDMRLVVIVDEDGETNTIARTNTFTVTVEDTGG